MNVQGRLEKLERDAGIGERAPILVVEFGGYDTPGACRAALIERALENAPPDEPFYSVMLQEFAPDGRLVCAWCGQEHLRIEPPENACSN